MALVIRELVEGDIPAVNEMHNREFGGARTLAEWNWEFREGPYGPAVFLVAEIDGELVGTHALLPLRLSHRGVVLPSGKNEETLVRSDARGQGVGKRLFAECFRLGAERGMKVLFGFTRTAPGPWAASGYAVPGGVPMALLVNRPVGAAVGLERTVGSVGRRRWKSVAHTVALGAGTGGLWVLGRLVALGRKGCMPDVAIETIDRGDERLDAFAAEYSRHCSACTVLRERDYMDWRVFRNPHVRHRVFAAVDGGRIVSMAVAGANPKNALGTIVDLCGLPGWLEKSAQALIGCCTKWCDEMRVGAIAAFRAHEELADSLLGAGFVPVPLKNTMQVRVLVPDSELSELTHMGSWRLTMLMLQGAR